MKQSNSNAPLDAVLETGGRTLSTPCCGCCPRHGVAQRTPPNAATAGMRMEWRRMTHHSEPLHSSFEGSPSSPRAAPARRPSPASASAARWPPDRRLLGVRHTRSPAALTQTRTDRPAHHARLGGQPVTGDRVERHQRTDTPHGPAPPPTQGGVQQGDENRSAAHTPSALATAAGTERTSRPVQIHP